MRIADKTVGAAQLRLWEPATDASAPRVRISRRARHVAIRVHDDASVELVVPRGVSESRARAFLESRSAWVQHQVQIRRAAARPPAPFPPARLELAAIDEVWLVHIGGDAGRPRLRESGNGLLELAGMASQVQWRARLVRWLKQRAAVRMQPLLQELAAAHGFTFNALSIRAQRSRWGSCSTRGLISINLAVLFQRPEVLRYLLCHELAHTRHMNHSPAFWRCVADCEPDYRRLDRELSQGFQRVPHWLARPLGGVA